MARRDEPCVVRTFRAHLTHHLRKNPMTLFNVSDPAGGLRVAVWNNPYAAGGAAAVIGMLLARLTR